MGRPRKSPSMTDGKREIISRLIEEYDIKTAEDIQDALRDLLGGTIQGMMECEMEAQKLKKRLQTKDSTLQLRICRYPCAPGPQQRLRTADSPEIQP